MKIQIEFSSTLKNDMKKRFPGSISTPLPSDDEIRRILIDRIDIRHQGIGIVVGVIGVNEHRVVAYGHLDQDDPRPLDGDTVFEIGSITKVFTRLLLADMVHRGEVSLDDPVARFLPSTVMVPERNGRTFTLVDLVTHTSGLPREPSNMNPNYTGNPYAGYTVEQLYQFLSHYSLTRDIGSQREYSNLGFGLLGHVLEKRAGMDYESLVFSRICTPLGISDTRITLTPEMKTRLAVGHDPGLTRIDNWDFPALPGFGALRSTVNNLLILRSVNLGLAKTSITPIITATTVKKDHSSTQVSSETGLSWGSIKSNGREICFHSGGTGGYRTWIGFDSLTQSGTVVLSNTAWDVNDIALHILDSASPLSKPPSEHTAKQIDSRLFDAYTGNYLLGPDFVLSVSREGNRLYTRATGIGKYEILPESECDFFYKEMDMQISFIMGVNGKATELVLHQDLETAHLQRIV